LAAAARTLKGLSQCTGFGMALLLLSDQVRVEAYGLARGLVSECACTMIRGREVVGA
jgi:hypothetical protein